VAAPRRGGPAAPAISRHLLLALTAAALTTLAGFAHDRTLSAGCNAVMIIGVAVVLARSAAGSAHPCAWRWYSASVALGGTGAALVAAVVPGAPTALGSIPGQLLVVLAIGLMLDRDALRAARSQLTTSLLLFLVADLLTVHTLYQLTIADTDLLSTEGTVSLFALLFSIAIGTGVSLLMMSVSHAAQRRVAGLVFAAQCCATAAAALSAVTTGPESLPYLASGMSVLGLGLLVAAIRADRPDVARTRDVVGPAASAMGSLLPHATAAVGGALLLVSATVTGRVTLFGTALGFVGLGVLFVQQTISWRTQQQLTRDLQRSEACFRTLVRGSADPVLIVDDQLCVEWVSPTITDLLGLDPQRTIGRSIADAVHPDDVTALVAALSDPQGDDD
jgi:PAS domain-containing protein